MVAVDVLLGRQTDAPPIDVVLCIVDASNLERNFYLVSQVLELGLPTVVALNMIDVAKDKGLQLDLELLAQRLPVKFVPVQANRGFGIADLKQALVGAADATQREVRRVASPFPPAFTGGSADACRQNGRWRRCRDSTFSGRASAARHHRLLAQSWPPWH